MSYFKELKRKNESPTLQTLEHHRKKFNAHYKLSQNNQMEFFASFARFLNLTQNLELKLKSSVKNLQKDITRYLNIIGNI
jgi:hypothetical protein